MVIGAGDRGVSAVEGARRGDGEHREVARGVSVVVRGVSVVVRGVGVGLVEGEVRLGHVGEGTDVGPYHLLRFDMRGLC